MLPLRTTASTLPVEPLSRLALQRALATSSKFRTLPLSSPSRHLGNLRQDARNLRKSGHQGHACGIPRATGQYHPCVADYRRVGLRLRGGWHDHRCRLRAVVSAMGWLGDGGTTESDSLHQGSTCPDQRGAQRREAMQEQRRHFPRRSQVMISLGSVDEGGEHADGANAILQFGYSAGSKDSRAGLALHDLADRRGGLVRMDHWRPASTRCWHSPRLACCSRSPAHPHQTAHTATERPRGG
ncbi:hypothetical protein SAMN05421547_1207 [Delftia lacustris]|uniref:Uncharacterized protein n=1 Tax=Delftia lacustris TaxID=558537 RepID=A0A1H3SG79_9BURK|nr:hypothetical protein SAMN05421547_1207 [Delftia lacustris]